MLTSRSNGGRRPTSSPPSSTRPSSGTSKPAMSRSVVVLPEPDGPSSVKNSPCATSRSTWSTAVKSPKRLTSPARRMSGTPGAAVVRTASAACAPSLMLDATLPRRRSASRVQPSRRARTPRWHTSSGGIVHSGAAEAQVEAPAEATTNEDEARAVPAGRGRGAVSSAFAALLAQLVEHFHGKEGVIGSSPMEGLQGRAVHGPEARSVGLRSWHVIRGPGCPCSWEPWHSAGCRSSCPRRRRRAFVPRAKAGPGPAGPRRLTRVPDAAACALSEHRDRHRVRVGPAQPSQRRHDRGSGALGRDAEGDLVSRVGQLSGVIR